MGGVDGRMPQSNAQALRLNLAVKIFGESSVSRDHSKAKVESA